MFRRGTWARLLALLALIALVGCGDDGGGGGGGAAEVIQVDPVYLEPGATSAVLAWPASRGAVESYLVFESRNGSAFGYSTQTIDASVRIDGQAGDSVQITVVALSPSGQMSESSPPSAPIIFQAAPSTAAATVAPAPSGATLLGAASTTETTGSSTNAELSVEPDASALGAQTDPAPDEASADTPDAAIEPLTPDLRERLLRGGTRLPVVALSTTAEAWLQAHVDAEVRAGVSIAGTGWDDEDDLIELVWQDQAGQLFVSDGASVLEATDLAATLVEGLRLSATERFVDLVDLDGNGVADWLIEDLATELVWIVDSETGMARAAVAIVASDRLVGSGDFDGDGRAELLWQAEDGRLSATRPSADASTEAPITTFDAVTRAGMQILALADFDGDGRDDLLALDDRGVLEIGLVADTADPNRLGLAWRDAGLAPLDGRELIATLDSDDDGAAELALLAGDVVELVGVDR